MQAFGLFGVTALVSLCAARSAMAQDLTETEQRIVQELEKSQQGLNSWKCTGVTTFQVSQQFRDKLLAGMKKMIAKNGQNEQIGEFNFDKPKVFFAAMQGERMLYSEKNLTVSLATFTPPASDVKILNNLVSTGQTHVHERGRNYRVDGERRGLTFSNAASSYILPVPSIGFYVPFTNLTPRELILNHGFRLVREATNQKFGKVLIFRGERPLSELSYPITFHLAPEFGYRVVYSILENKKAHKQNVHLIKSLVNIQGHWLPEESEDRNQSDDPSVTEPELVTLRKFANHSVNDIIDAMLEVKPASGDHEWNEKDNTGYKFGANGEKIFLDNSTVPRPRKILPIWLYPASITTLLILTILAYIRWKRKQ